MSGRTSRFAAFVVVLVVSLAGSLSSGRSEPPANASPLRPPSVPLVATDPYLSIWSNADHLNDDSTRHWTGREHPLVSLIRVDGESFRLMGKEPKEVDPLPQVGLQVLPTQSIYEFGNAKIHVSLTFMTPALPDDLDVLARPLTYLTWTVQSVDGRAHEVAIYDSTSALLAVNEPDQEVEWSRETTKGKLTLLRVGTSDQTLLRPSGDDTRIDWGYAYASAPMSRSAIGPNEAMLKSFVDSGKIAETDEVGPPRPANVRTPVLAFTFDLGKVAAEPVSRHLMLAYDEVYAVNFLGRKLRPYWRKNGWEPADLFQAAERDYASLVTRCATFDTDLMASLAKEGGERYALMAALAYRQTLAGCGLAADAEGKPLIFPKENTSNGCIATVDVIYPAAPQFLLMGPTYAKALVVPAMIYGASPRWKFPFAPHDLGVYPQATGQVYGGGESPGNESEKMPVEESANLILLCQAIARMDGNADFASRWWPQLTRWENYLEKYGLDPENQLCTDDFMGHLAHNANLSIKAILAIAAYGDLCRMRGDAASAEKYFQLARADARHWVEAAADGNHSRIAFDKPNSWSQKYNLVFDKILGLNVFPAEVARREVAYYLTLLQPFGLPLDSRTRLTKTDWSVWSATLAENPADFERIVSPIVDYLNKTTARVAFVDSYITDNIRSDGMHARPVIGGVFIKMLADPAVWKAWASRDKAHIDRWADAPVMPSITEVVATSRQTPADWRYTFDRPAQGWTLADFDDHAWKVGPGGFGVDGTPGAVIKTTWNTPDVWLRREIRLPDSADPAKLQFLVYHDEDVEIYLDGVLAAKDQGYLSSYEPLDIRPAARAKLGAGQSVVIAVHCHQTRGGQGVDLGLVEVKESTR